MAETKKKLFDQFAPVTPEEWRAKAEVDLKGAGQMRVSMLSRCIAALTLPTSSRPNHSPVSSPMSAEPATTTTGRCARTSTSTARM